ncbi:MAG TPA: SUMF1/EgtB/PvdO family nonheme iron enzyme [Nitrospinaceae bacterium]|nr:SUMF1/EgtB/PvdO family nonheme iron enzyme [Nitrospinaceae bacterium]
MKRFIIIYLMFTGMILTGCESPPEGMVLVPAGNFIMGTDEVDTNQHALKLGLGKPWFADESPAFELYLKDYYIDKYEVTRLQYYIFCQATDHKPPRTWGGDRFPEGTGHYPVSHVNFYDAAAYAEWSGKRLPTEAEWEKAARGPDHYIYPWGNEFDFSSANVSPSAKKKRGRGLKPVGSFPQGVSFYGTYDMIGNVWEWVWDYYLPYPNNTNVWKKKDEKLLVVRGMSYLGVGHFSEEEYRKVIALKSRGTSRERLNPFSRKDDVGFRCAKDKLSIYERVFGKSLKDMRVSDVTS